MKNLILSLFVLSLSACASIQAASPEQDSEAKRFQPVSDQAVVYIFRDETLGAALHKSVIVNRKYLGVTGPDSYFRAVVPPGMCHIDSEGESVLDVAVNAGKVYYVWQEMKMGLWAGSTQLNLVGEERGRQGVMDSKLIETNSN